MTKKEKEMEQYIIKLCKEADVEYDPEFGSHIDDDKFNKLFKRDVQKQLDYMVEEGFCEVLEDGRYLLTENPADLKS